MVSRYLCLALSLCIAAAPLAAASGAPTPFPATATAQPLSSTATPLPALPDRPAFPQLTPNHPIEDFAAITLISIPFACFWALLGTMAWNGFQQGRFPPEVDTPLLAAAAATAGVVSLGIATVSVSWGRGVAPRTFQAPVPRAEPPADGKAPGASGHP